MIRKIRKTIALCLSLCLLLMYTAALAEAPVDYALPYEAGVVHRLYILPGGDMLTLGSYGRETPGGQNADTTIARMKPDGSEVWTIDLSFEESGSGGIIPLSDNRYMVAYSKGGDDDLHILFIDAGQDAAEEIQLPIGDQHIFAADEGFILSDQNQSADSVRLSWLDPGGREIRNKDYAFTQPQEMELTLLETEDALYMLAQYYRGTKDVQSSLTKLTKEGLLQWQKKYDTYYPYMYMFQPDGEGGVLLIGSNGMYDDKTQNPYTARRIDKEGNTVWEKGIDVGEWLVRSNTSTEDGIEMIWETDDTFRFVTMDRDGVLTEGPVRGKPNIGMEGVSCPIAGCTTDDAGRLWVYYNMIWEIDMYNTDVKPFIQPLDAFVIRGQG